MRAGLREILFAGTQDLLDFLVAYGLRVFLLELYRVGNQGMDCSDDRGDYVTM